MISLTPVNSLTAITDILFSGRVQALPRPADRDVGRRHRLDPVRARARRLRLPSPPRVDRHRPRRQAAERALPRALLDLLHRRRRRPRAARPRRCSTGSCGRWTTRTPTRPGPMRPNSSGRVMRALPDDDIDGISHAQRDARASPSIRSRTGRRSSARCARCGPRPHDVDIEIKSMGRRKAEADGGTLSARLAAVASKGAPADAG